MKRCSGGCLLSLPAVAGECFRSACRRAKRVRRPQELSPYLEICGAPGSRAPNDDFRFL